MYVKKEKRVTFFLKKTKIKYINKNKLKLVRTYVRSKIYVKIIKNIHMCTRLYIISRLYM